MAAQTQAPGEQTPKEKRLMADIDKDLAQDTTSAALWYEKGMAHVMAQETPEAIECFSRGLIYAPFDADLRAQRGRKHIGLEKYAMAVSDLRLASHIKPWDWEVWYYFGVAAYLFGDYELAKETHVKARALMLKNNIEAIPATVDWYWMSCMKLGQKQEAQRVLDEYITADMPTEDGDYLARVLLYKGELAAEGFVETAMKNIKNPERPRIYYLMLTFGLANWLLHQGRTQESIPLLKELAESPDSHALFAVKQAMMLLDDLGVAYTRG